MTQANRQHAGRSSTRPGSAVRRADVRIEPVDPFEHVETLFAIYCAALAAPPGERKTREWRDATLARHAARADFDFLAAFDGAEIAGFAYGYTGGYGQWWTDRVAAAMDADLRAGWLDPPHFEVVELHVRPDRQRRGVGTRLLDALLARQPHDRALLTADPVSEQAMSFYAKQGWRPLADVVLVPGAGVRIVLGRRIDPPVPGPDAQAASRSSSRPSRSSRQSSV